MTLPLGDPLGDPDIQWKFDQISLQWPGTVGALHVVGASGEPAFQNAWVNFGGTDPSASFYKDRGRVYLAGSVKSGTLAAPIFTLPVGYRPPSDTVRFAVIDGSAGPGGTVIVFASGAVHLQTGNNVFVSLAPVDFRAA